MINFEEEIKKFELCEEINSSDTGVKVYEQKDMMDLLGEVIKEIKKEA